MAVLFEPKKTSSKKELKPKEGDASSGFAQNLRKKESVKCRTSFRESADGQAPGNVFKVVIIQEGLGNLSDCSYYTREALEQAVNTQAFEGKKIFADHPSAIEEEVRPERSVRDIIGYLKNVQLDTSGDRAQIIADACLAENAGWAKDFMSEAINYSQQFMGQEFVGLSINANGEASPMSVDELSRSVNIPSSAMEKINQAVSMGIQSVQAVTNIADVFSVDLVTEAGAGGKILALVESSKGKGKSMSKKKEMEKKESKHENESESHKEAIDNPQAKENESHKENEHKETDGKEHENESEGETTPPTKQPESTNDGGEGNQDNNDPAEGDHADEQQDMELIKKMLDQYIGEPTHDPEIMKQAKEAYEACMGSGMKDKEAMETAGHAMKMGKIMGMKQSGEPKLPDAGKSQSDLASEAESHKENNPELGKDQSGTPNKIDGKNPEQAKSGAKQMVHESEVSKIRGENAALKTKIAILEANQWLDKTLEASGLPRKVTKDFRESLKEVKSKEIIEKEYKKFLEGYNKGQGSLAIDYDGIVNPERTEMSETSASGVDYDSCMDN